MKKFSKKQYISAGIIGAFVLIVVVVLVSRNGNGSKELITVLRRDVVEEVIVSGRVEAGSVADLGFEVSGRVNSVSAREGDTVQKGALLISLDLGTLFAELASSEADALIKEVELKNSQTNLEDVIKQQDTLVESAYSKLLSSNLDPVASKTSVSATTPIITGRYTGPEGRYKIRVASQEGNVGKYDLLTFDVDRTGPVEISETTVTPLGSYGLFISFPDDLSQYRDTIWFIDIPNKDASSYTANLNAYEEAIRDRNLAIQQAKADVGTQDFGTSIAQAELARAKAGVARIQAEIERRRLFAPFSGIVTQVYVDPGEIVSANTVVASLISNDGFGIEVDLPEIDSFKVNIGNPARVALDAFGDNVVFDAMVTSVNRTETIVDNVSVYEARLVFTIGDDRIGSGMTADVTIETSRAGDVLALPARALIFRGDKTFVLKKNGDSTDETQVITGLRGSDGFVEIRTGLNEGDKIFVPNGF